MAAVETAVDGPIVPASLSSTESQTSATNTDTEILAAVAERLQFFFSNANIRQDAFMRRYLLVSSKDDPTDDKFSVPISSLLKFHTIQRLTTSPEVIIQAAQTHLKDVLLVIEAFASNEPSLKRCIPFTKDLLSEHIPLSLYVYNLPLTSDQMKYAVSVQDIRQLFGPSTDDAIALVKLKFRPRSSKSDDSDLKTANSDEPETSKSRNKWIPCGGAMVEFKTIEQLEKAASATLTIKDGVSVTPERPLFLPHGDSSDSQPLQVMLLSEYKDRPDKEKIENHPLTTVTESETGVTEQESDQPPVQEGFSQFTIDWKPGCVIVLQGIANPATKDDSEQGIDCDREAILEAVAQGLKMTVADMKEQKMVYVDYSRGQTHGAIRFSEPSEQVATICQLLQEGSIAIANVTVESVRILSGSEEQEYWDHFIQFKTQQKQNQEKNSKRKALHGHHTKRSKRRY